MRFEKVKTWLRTYIFSVDIKVNILTISAAILIMLTDLVFNRIPELFPGGSGLLNALYNVCVGVIASYVFFLFVVHWKDIKDRENIASFVEPKVTNILRLHELAIDLITKYSKVTFESNFPSEDELLSAFTALDYNQRTNVLSSNGFARVIDQLESISQDIFPRIQTIFTKMTFLPPAVVRVLSEMEERGFSRTFRGRFHPTQFENVDELLSKEFYIFSQQCKELKVVRDNNYL